MINLSEFGECLKDLMTEKNMGAVALAKEVSIHENSIHRYMAGAALPTLDSALKLADFFQCSIEYLLARTESNNPHCKNTPPPFSERLRFLFKYFSGNEYRLARAAKISRSRTHAWLTGESAPSIDNLVKIADYYGTTIDFVIGREN